MQQVHTTASSYSWVLSELIYRLPQSNHMEKKRCVSDQTMFLFYISSSAWYRLLCSSTRTKNTSSFPILSDRFIDFLASKCQGYFTIKITAQEVVCIQEKDWSRQRFTWSFTSIIPPLDCMVQISRCLFMAITRTPSITRSSRSVGSTNK